MSVENTIGALYAFFSGFGIPAYPEDNVPMNAAPPYVTVQLLVPEWRRTAPFYARLWYRSGSYAPLLRKADEIARAIGGGVSLPVAGGCVIIGKEDNFAQIMPFQGDTTLKCAYLSMNLQALND